MIVVSQNSADDASYRQIVDAGDYWLHTVKQGQTLGFARKPGRGHVFFQCQRPGRAVFSDRYCA